MALKRSELKNALADRLAAKVTAAKNVYRRWWDFGQLPASKLPALMLVTDQETPDQRPGMPPIWSIAMELWIVTSLVQNDENPEEQLEAIVSQVESALEMQPRENGSQHETTLGGKARRVFISGAIEVIQGVTGGQSVAVVPIEIVAVG